MYEFFHKIDSWRESLSESYAKLHSMSLGEELKTALFEKIEDEYDITATDKTYDEYIKGGRKSKPISELWKEFDIWFAMLRLLPDLTGV